MKTIRQAADDFDGSLFKSRDLEFVLEVVNFLKGKGLQPELRGSVVEDAEKGRPREYNDIDILVTSDEPFGASRVINNLLDCYLFNKVYDYAPIPNVKEPMKI